MHGKEWTPGSEDVMVRFEEFYGMLLDGPCEVKVGKSYKSK